MTQTIENTSLNSTTEQFHETSAQGLMDPYKITIIGSGAMGTAAAINLIREHRAGLDERPPLEIEIIDPLLSDRYGSQVYQDGTALLNQPGAAMVVSNNAEEFPNFLVENGIVSTQEKARAHFATRAQFGEFLTDTINKEVQKVDNAKIKVTLTKAKVTDVSHSNGAFHLTLDSRSQSQAHHVIAAPGHHNNPLFAHLNDEKNYIATPHDIEKRNHALEGADTVAVIGSSQSALEYIMNNDNDTCEFVLFSSEPEKPWEFKYNDFLETKNKTCDISEFVKQLNPEKTPQEVSESLDGLIEVSAAMKFNPAQVVVAVRDKIQDGSINLSDEAKAHLEKRCGAIYGNPTSPQYFEKLAKLEEQGRIRYEKTRINPDEVDVNDNGGFSIINASGQREEFDALLNGAPFVRDAFDQNGNAYSALIQNFAEQGWLRISKDRKSIEAGRQTQDNLYIIGVPTAKQRKFGMETFMNPVINTVACVINETANKPEQKYASHNATETAPEPTTA